MAAALRGVDGFAQKKFGGLRAIRVSPQSQASASWRGRRCSVFSPAKGEIEREQGPMIDITYDPEADAAYIYLGRGKIVETAEAGPFIYDVDAQGRVIGIEILAASKVLAPGD
jgi:uncharacterized protein YuzE